MMKTMYLILLLQTSQTDSLLAKQPGFLDKYGFLLMIALMFLVMYLFMIRPQRQQQKKLEEMRNSLKKGDKVVTAGGIYGTIADIDERTILVKVDGETKLRVDKSSVQKDLSDTPAKSDK